MTEKVVVLVEVLGKCRFPFDLVHGVVGVDEELGKPGAPVVVELIGHSPVDALDLVRKLLVVMFLVPDGSQQVSNALGIVTPPFRQVFGD